MVPMPVILKVMGNVRLPLNTTKHNKPQNVYILFWIYCIGYWHIPSIDIGQSIKVLIIISVITSISSSSLQWLLLNTLGASDVYQRQWARSSTVKVMFVSSRYYLNQPWLYVNWKNTIENLILSRLWTWNRQQQSGSHFAEACSTCPMALLQ